jgi:hypothetical protein
MLLEIITHEHTPPLSTLNSMVTPAVLIAVCATLTLGTSQRLNRVIDRTRKLFEMHVNRTTGNSNETQEQLNFESMWLHELISRQTKRVSLLQKAITTLYFALSFFVTTCLMIGVVQIGRINAAWLPLSFGMIGALLLFYACILFINETSIALEAVSIEMDFIKRLIFSPDKPFTVNARTFWKRIWINS